MCAMNINSLEKTAFFIELFSTISYNSKNCDVHVHSKINALQCLPLVENLNGSNTGDKHYNKCEKAAYSVEK